MRAVVLHKFGDPKDLKIEEISTPSPSGDDVLVEVRAAAINPSDVKNVEGAMHGTTLPRIPGRDFSGVITKGSARMVGREVWGTGGDIGFTRDGSHAQFVLLPADAVAIKPSALSMDAAGTAGLTFVTAWLAMVVAAGVSRGETAVIVGAAGGVGSAAVQIAKARGARVIGGVREDKDVPAAREVGADEVVNTGTSNLAEAVRSLTQGRGADVVFDSSGQVFADAVESAAVGGRLPIISAPKDGKVTLNLRTIYRNQLTVHGVDTRKLDAVACAKLLAEMLPSFESGAFKVKPGEAYPLDKAADAYQRAAHGGTRVFFRPNS